MTPYYDDGTCEASRTRSACPHMMLGVGGYGNGKYATHMDVDWLRVSIP